MLNINPHLSETLKAEQYLIHITIAFQKMQEISGIFPKFSPQIKQFSNFAKNTPILGAKLYFSVAAFIPDDE